MPSSVTARAATRAGLNFGDCPAYALAMFKGTDFGATDVMVVQAGTADDL